MSFNQFMHPRNPFKKKPDYKALAEKYPEFEEYLVPYPSKKKFKINFNDPNALRCLSTILLKDQFDLDVKIPLNRLIPSIPQRLNYVLWLEDIVQSCFDDSEIISLIDCGTGASCVFPLISVKLNSNWRFVATELDDYSLQCAKQNCESNQLDGQIKVIKGKHDQLLPDLVKSEEFHALMCNPPFFETRDDQDKQSTSNMSTLAEATFDGGEDSFVSKLIDESFLHKDKIKLFTVMLGKKTSFKSLRKRLQSHQEDNILKLIDTEFCQGKTIRWGLAWTFDLSLDLSSVQKMKHAKNPIFTYKLPETRFLSRYCTLDEVTRHILELLDDIQIGKPHICDLTKSKHKIEFIIKTNLNTWSHQRKKKRLAQRMNNSVSHSAEKSKQIDLNDLSHQPDDRPMKRRLDAYEFITNISSEMDLIDLDCDSNDDQNKHSKKVRTSSESKNVGEAPYLLNCRLRVKKEKEVFYLEISLNDRAKEKDSVHQLFQYLKNNLT